ncbi:MAG: Gfo/Idh/MocA family protein, partial [Armatimonadota bacterium]
RGERVLGANDRFVVGIIGCKGRSQRLAQHLAERDDVDIKYICDVDSTLFDKSLAHMEKLFGRRPKTTMDFREMLDDGDVDVIVNATPDHWHAIPTIMGCQAGKDVYVEKPASHNIWEGRKMVEAARKYDRVVQLGTQNRSAAYTQAATDYIRSGELGDVHLVRILNMKTRSAVPPQPDEPVPEGVDYDTWLGPAPKRPFNRNHFHYKWHWFWNYSGGDIINDGVHQVDLARWIVGVEYPKSVVATGGKYAFDDAQETPDTQHVLYDYDGMTMTFELTLWTPYMKKTPGAVRDSDELPDWRYNATRIEVYGTKGLMIMGRHGGGWQVFDDSGDAVVTKYGRHPINEHIEDFFACCRSRQRPNADIEEGHISTVLCHLGNISYRCGGRKLYFDADTETFIGDKEANKLVKRTYRKPWVIPDKV